jgi:predicted DNA-binding ribbon-helix-helix protein
MIEQSNDKGQSRFAGEKVSTKLEQTLFEALEEIASGKWTSSGDLLGATLDELSAVWIARKVIQQVKEGA